MMNPVPWLQMTNMISYQGLVRTFPELMALVNKSDEDIDYSDIPASGSEAWSDAKRGNFLPDPGIHAQ
nr:hypothetical protein [Escherichia coli]